MTTAAATAAEASARGKRNMATPSNWVSAVCTHNILLILLVRAKLSEHGLCCGQQHSLASDECGNRGLRSGGRLPAETPTRTYRPVVVCPRGRVSVGHCPPTDFVEVLGLSFVPLHSPLLQSDHRDEFPVCRARNPLRVLHCDFHRGT